ncbi:TonB-dependent receptor [Sphingomonas lenta]|uniref:TonB-dependent receptor n=1 Tax=Sphingomonas lenta TaxID=1141887 RepID=A0A2A2SBT3_9SPHN|nr:TonB-dependent receptor [Sphingomonas lenta]PAX06717.1 TonB-dependent receptor [Sphingomonas lenta]
MFQRFLGASLAALAFAQAASAQQISTLVEPQDQTGETVVVTAPVQRTEDELLQGVTVLTGAELDRQIRGTIGETLARQPGVSATSFGPNASRPILRGFQGERIRVLTDGIGSFDASNTSVDHPVVIDPLLAERIEVLRGPSALLFGSSAVGGVVNVLDRRIPRTAPEGGARADVLASYGSAAEERSASGSADVALGRFVLNANGSYLKSDDLRTGGYILSRDARRQALTQVGLPQDVEEGEEPVGFAANANLRGEIPNTAAETWTAGVGGSLVTDTGHLGIAYQRYDSFVGVPARLATEVGQEQEAPRLDIRQDRFDLRAEVETGGGLLDRIRLRAGHADYRHFEIEPSGEIGTTFLSKGTEGRVELVQAQRGGWQGATGAQYFNRRIDVEGEEAFLPRSETEQFGLFTLQSVQAGPVRIEGGLRYERTEQSSRPGPDQLQYFRGERRFDAFSGSLGAAYAFSDRVNIGVNLSRTERAPSAEELFSNGNHKGTQAYELGDPGFGLEKSWGLEGTFHAHGGRFSLDASAFYNDFDDFIYESRVSQEVCEAAALGGEVELACFQYRQRDARFYGFEIDASVLLAETGGYRFNADLIADYVRATIENEGPAPRIPPLRLLGGLEMQGDRLSARVEAEHVFEQDRVTEFETPTDDFTLVNASLSFRPFGPENRTSVVLSANNIFDVEARRHASFLKDFAPLAGRDLRATLRIGL